MAIDASGNLYGTAEGGGADYYGTVFELEHGKSGWTEETLYSFTGQQDGGYPSAALVQHGKSWYSTAYGGGNTSACYTGCGSIFKLAKSGSTWTETTLYLFQGGADGGEPENSVLFNDKGDLYGTTTIGGDHGVYGVVYELKP